MAEDYEIYKILRAERAKEGEKRRQTALKDYNNAAALANQVGWQFTCHSEVHYSLRKPQENSWILNVYPGNRRLYYDPNKPKGPFLRLKDDWSLTDVVLAAIQQNNITANFKMPTQESIQEKAYHLWQRAGSPPGDGTQFWLQAEREINEKSNDNEPDLQNERGRD
jgi:hypothetical protein